MSSADAAAPALSVRDLRVALGGRTVLDGVSLDLPQGQILSLVGPNGAGKSTLLRCLLRIVPRQGGAIEIHGRALDDHRQPELARQIAYVPQDVEARPPFTVSQYVMLSRFPYLGPLSSGGPEDREAVAQALRRTGSTALAHRRLGTLSGGERQKVLIAAALAQGAPVLLLDEPTTFLDPRHQAEVLDILTRIHAEQGISVLMVTHDINTAATRAHRVAALKEGRVVFDGAPGELMAPDVLRSVFDHDFTLATHPVSGAPVVVP